MYRMRWVSFFSWRSGWFNSSIKFTKILPLLKMFIKAVCDTVFDMINAVYHDKPLIFIGATFRKTLVSHQRAVNEADSCLLMRRAGLKVVARTKKSHLIGRVLGVKLPKTADHWSVRSFHQVLSIFATKISWNISLLKTPYQAELQNLKFKFKRSAASL